MSVEVLLSIGGSSERKLEKLRKILKKYCNSYSTLPANALAIAGLTDYPKEAEEGRLFVAVWYPDGDARTKQGEARLIVCGSTQEALEYADDSDCLWQVKRDSDLPPTVNLHERLHLQPVHVYACNSGD